MRKNFIITEFEKWVLNRICKKLAVANGWQDCNVETYLRIMIDAIKKSLAKDNQSISAFMGKRLSVATERSDKASDKAAEISKQENEIGRLKRKVAALKSEE